MADQTPTPMPPEKPKPTEAAVEKPEKEKQGFEVLEKEAELESKREEELIDQLAQLRSKMVNPPVGGVTSNQQVQLDSDIEQRKKKIIENFVKAAAAANFEEKKVEHIMHVAERYIRKDYPDIADEIHDRVTEEMNKKS